MPITDVHSRLSEDDQLIETTLQIRRPILHRGTSVSPFLGVSRIPFGATLSRTTNAIHGSLARVTRSVANQVPSVNSCEVPEGRYIERGIKRVAVWKSSAGKSNETRSRYAWRLVATVVIKEIKTCWGSKLLYPRCVFRILFSVVNFATSTKGDSSRCFETEATACYNVVRFFGKEARLDRVRLT